MPPEFVEIISGKVIPDTVHVVDLEAIDENGNEKLDEVFKAHRVARDYAKNNGVKVKEITREGDDDQYPICNQLPKAYNEKGVALFDPKEIN